MGKVTCSGSVLATCAAAPPHSPGRRYAEATTAERVFAQAERNALEKKSEDGLVELDVPRRQLAAGFTIGNHVSKFPPRNRMVTSHQSRNWGGRGMKRRLAVRACSLLGYSEKFMTLPS